MYGRGTGGKNTSDPSRVIKTPSKEVIVAAAERAAEKFAEQYAKAPSAGNAMLVELATAKLVEVSREGASDRKAVA